MAVTREAGRLSEAHRLAQARLGAQTVLAMRAVWPLLDIDNIERTVERWLTAARHVVGSQRSTSARLAANYLTTYKTLELGATANTIPLILADLAPVEAVTTSLMVTGPVSVRSALARGIRPTVAMDVAQARSSASAMRHVLNGGRDTITNSLQADRQAIGWQRVTSGNSCQFCSMLAGRGAVFSTTTISFHAHDGCSCSAAPVYRNAA